MYMNLATSEKIEMAEPILKLSIPYHNREFFNYEEVSDWLKKLRDQWSWYLLDPAVSATPFKQNLDTALSLIHTGLANLTANDTKMGHAEIEDGIRRYQANIAIVPEDGRFKYAESVAESNLNAAGFLIEYLAAKNQIGNARLSNDMITAHIYKLIYETGSKQGLSAQNRTIEILKSELGDERILQNRRFEDLEDEFDTLVEQTGKHQAKVHNATETAVKWAKQDRSNFLNDHEQAIDQAQDRLNKFEHTVKEKIAMLHPIKYWESKSRSHQTRAAWLFGFFAFLLALGVMVLFAFSQEMVAKILSSESPYSISFLFIAMFGIFAWPLRIVSKIAMGNLHQATDFDERATLIKTYISFLENDHISGDKEYRLMVLQAIFRPSATGIVREDGQPSFQDFLGKVVYPK